jgi:hypothetical protein
LHKWTVSRILLIVTNREDEGKRAKTTKRIIQDMGASDIPVAFGTAGSRIQKPFHTYKDNTDKPDEPDDTIPNGEAAIIELLNRLRK